METQFTATDEGFTMAPKELSESSIRIQGILEMIEDPEMALSEINKKIAMEIAYISADMAESASDSLKAFRVKALSEQVKALRELAKTLTEAEQLSKRDILNFDGPKFQFVLSEIVKLFKKALIQANLTESQSNDVLKLFRDLLALYEPVLRKETDRISSKS
jgi:ribosome-binding ATPase YchF (GTP1/OBG family)